MATVGLVSTAFWITHWSIVAVGGPDAQALMRALQGAQRGRLMDLTLVNHGCFFALGVFMWAMKQGGSSVVRRGVGE